MKTKELLEKIATLEKRIEELEKLPCQENHYHYPQPVINPQQPPAWIPNHTTWC